MATPNSITFKKVNWKHLVLNGVHIWVLTKADLLRLFTPNADKDDQ